MKFMPEPVSTCTVGGTRRCSSSSWYSCQTQPTYTPVDEGLLPSISEPAACMRWKSSENHQDDINASWHPALLHGKARAYVAFTTAQFVLILA